jgi:hypothetical protein
LPALDPNTLTWLIALSAGDLSWPVPECAVDWDNLLAALSRHRVATLAYATLSHEDRLDQCPLAFQKALRNTHYVRSLGLVAKFDQLKRVVSHLQAGGVDFLVLKGPVVAHTVYPDPYLRDFSDLDLLVRAGDEDRMDDALYEFGYAKQDYPGPPMPKLIPQVINTVHTLYVHAGDGLPVEVHCDDVLFDGLVPRGLDDMWRRAVTVTMENCQFQALSFEDHLLHLCAHLHHHRFDQLYRVADLLFYLRDHSGEIDWDAFLRSVRLEEAQVPVYYSFLLVGQLYGVSAPAPVMAALKPDRFRRFWSGHYMAWDAVRTFSDTETLRFSFKSTPWLRSTLMNLLVMGRRWDKLHYLFRLVFPTADWLQQRYHLPEGRSVLPYYVLRWMPARWLERRK